MAPSDCWGQAPSCIELTKRLSFLDLVLRYFNQYWHNLEVKSEKLRVGTARLARSPEIFSDNAKVRHSENPLTNIDQH